MPTAKATNTRLASTSRHSSLTGRGAVVSSCTRPGKESSCKTVKTKKMVLATILTHWKLTCMSATPSKGPRHAPSPSLT